MATAEEIYLVDIKHRRDYVRTASGDLELESGEENARQAIIRRIMTNPGSIVHRPDYGVGIKNYQGAVSTLEQKRALGKAIVDQVEQDDRVRSVLGVRIDIDDDTPEKTVLTVRVELVGLGEVPVTITPFGGEVVS